MLVPLNSGQLVAAEDQPSEHPMSLLTSSS